MTKWIIFTVIVVFVLEVVFQVKKQKDVSKLENELTSALLKKDYRKFDELVNSVDAKKNIPPYNLNYLKLNAAIIRGKKQDIDSLCDNFENVHMNQAQKENFYATAFGYYAQQNNKKKALYYKDKILKESKNEKNIEACKRMYSVYIESSDEYLDVLLKECESLSGQQRTTNDALLAKIYENKNDKENEEKYLKQLKEDSLQTNK